MGWKQASILVSWTVGFDAPTAGSNVRTVLTDSGTSVNSSPTLMVTVVATAVFVTVTFFTYRLKSHNNSL